MSFMKKDPKDEKKAYLRLSAKMRPSLSTLDDDIVEHSAVHQEICEWVAWAKRRAANAHAAMKSTTATGIIGLRKTMSEDSSKRSWESTPDYSSLMDSVAKAAQSVDLWDGLRETSLQKSYMINNLVNMIAGGHLSMTVRPRNGK